MTATADQPTGLRQAQEIADQVFFPAAATVDASDHLPVSHLDLLAEQGFYGLAAPPHLSTLELPDFPAVCRVIETLASGCLTTTFVWAQHHNAVMAAANTQNEQLKQEFLEPLATGRRRSGLAIGAAVRPGPAAVTATAVDGGWLLTGDAPWVSGWGLVDTLYVAGRDGDDTLVWALVDAVESDSLTVEPLAMTAVNASSTVTVRFREHFVPAARISGLMPLEAWRQRDPATLRFNGSLALGVAARAIALADSEDLAKQLDSTRDTLDMSGPDTMPQARAAASHLALRACATLAVAEGSRAVLRDQHAQRLMREATFLLVFGSRPGIRSALTTALAG
ncbi:acyl-CoA/acyl-ACP dehydrogenase [Micromonospora sp. R77]|uniref:acyl-CoA dehydrogenase family protein n=1 Tax=Micromonospora sp. R77 TaxID=2925836 RepID=UPI001F612249|nr:acyl-CoA dehydrogenase family protein [Micromonospora sp. R77]MCI4066447.1 acyl-CoA/acyl-ACP dehydrogenase [Micromonospora sp. R77]